MTSSVGNFEASTEKSFLWIYCCRKCWFIKYKKKLLSVAGRKSVENIHRTLGWFIVNARVDEVLKQTKVKFCYQVEKLDQQEYFPKSQPIYSTFLDIANAVLSYLKDGIHCIIFAEVTMKRNVRSSGKFVE